MGRTMPAQRPGKSEQTVLTPPVFLRSVCSFLGITDFYRDLAADKDNRVVRRFYSKENDGLLQDWRTPEEEWNWLNPPFAKITPWVRRANERFKGRGPQAHLHNTAILIPASTGSNWWRDYVHRQAMVLFLNGRITFHDKDGNPVCSPKTGKPTPFPKDLALLLYSSAWAPGYEVWDWRV